MSEKEDKLREKIERQEDESRRKERQDEGYRRSDRDITKMEDPDKWPDPPKEKKDRAGKE